MPTVLTVNLCSEQVKIKVEYILVFQTESRKVQSSTTDSVTEKPNLQKPDKELMLKEARNVLTEWARSLREMEQVKLRSH